jgi:hypothetical protein
MIPLFTCAALFAAPSLAITDFQLVAPMARAGRPVTLTARLANPGATPLTLQPTLTLPPGVTVLDPPAAVTIDAADDADLTCRVQAAAAGEAELTLVAGAAKATLRVLFLPPVEISHPDYIPPPQPAPTELLIGAHHCPLWEPTSPHMWDNILLRHPERTPALGYYDQANPEVADWETKWAVEHGINYFVYCWYRTSQGGPVTTMFSSAIEQALLKSRFRDRFHFTIMWENQSRGRAGVSDEHDLLTNLLPYWIEHYFRSESYLKVDGKPVLFIYRPEFLVQDLGGEAQVAAAFDKMRAACVAAGFKGLWLLGEYRGLDPKHLALMKRLGLDYTFAYCWYVGGNPTPAQAIAAQQHMLAETRQLGILPQVCTVCQAWSGWRDEGTIWKLPPSDFETLLRWAKDFVAAEQSPLGRRMLLLDNWNEWGEGHYIAPYREYGFGYLDAVRRVFSTAPEPHVDLLPEDIGRGPYDSAMRARLAQEAALRRPLRRRVTKPGAEAEGLIGWWSFDEAADSPVACDDSGHRRGGRLHDAKRAPGWEGQALVCDGGTVLIDPDPAWCPPTVSVECRVRTDQAAQDNKWIVNHVMAGGVDTGWRLGLMAGKPAFEVPLTDWSHYAVADAPLPTGRWVHLCGTYDGQMVRIYVDGVEGGAVARAGAVKPNSLPLVLGGYEVGHPAHFVGLLDEVKLWARALSAAEVRAEAEG